jgi:tetratricopeptide (TPR) repeat protein/GTPase SAR1 family protein
MEYIQENIDTDNAEFQTAWNLIQYSSASVFLTGRAGTGKSTFLRYVCRNTHKKYIVLAPTGIAAINVEGVTLHSFFKIPLRPILPNDPDLSVENRRIFDFLKYNKAKRTLLKEVELIIIDEISMVRADILDFVDQVLRVFTGNKHLPFGGKQLLMVGDAFQLEPVVKKDEWQILSRFYPSPYFFSANVFKVHPLVQIELKQVYRQNDAAFIDILDRIRLNQANRSHLEVINSRLNPNFTAKPEDFFITLATRRDTVDYINEIKLNELKGKEYSFAGRITGEFPESSLPTLKNLVLKEQAQVMFVKNDTERRWYNGSLGIVEDIDDEGIYVRLENDELHLVTPEKWVNLQYKYDEKNNRITADELGAFSQYPLKLAWAITVHKSQGLTFQNVMIDLSGGAFAGGQLYVALSRCRTLEGMVLKTPVRQSDIIVNREVVQFAAQANNKKLIEEELRKAKADTSYLTALHAFRSGNWKQAVNSFAEAISYRNDLENPYFRRFIAKEMLFIDHYRHQIADLEAKLKHQQENLKDFAREYYLMANECELKFNDTRAALGNLNKAIKLDPKFVDALLRRANLLFASGDYSGAEKDCTAILRSKRRHFKALLLRGQIRTQTNALELAYKDLLEAMNLKKSDPEVYRALSKVCAKMGEDALAEQYNDIASNLEDMNYE